MSVPARAAGFPPAADPEKSGPVAGGDDVSALVALARGGDRPAFGQLVDRYQRRTYAFALRVVGNAHDAEDVTQETFVKAWHSLGGYRERGRFRTWLFTIARRTALNHLRRRRPTEELKDHDIAVEANPSDTAGDRDDAAALWATARRLTADQYQALWLCYGEGFSTGDVARIMNASPLRVRVLLHRARKRLAAWLQPGIPAADSPPEPV